MEPQPITPKSWDTFDFIDLFAGTGGIRIPFDELGGRCVFTSEWDEHAQKTYEANFGHKPFGDITQIVAKTIPDHDLLLGGFPCQAFSGIGNQRGFAEARGTLFFNIAEILDVKKPYGFLLENVKNLRSHDGGNTFNVITSTLKNLGYHLHTTVLNALDFGLPQKRERTILVGFKDDLEFHWPTPVPGRANLADFLEPSAALDASLKASQYIIQKRKDKIAEQGDTPFYPSIWHENKSKHVSILPHSVALRTDASHNYILVNGERLPSERELLNFQGFPQNFKIVVPRRQIRRQAGNAVPVPMIRAVANSMLTAMRGAK